MNQYAHDLPAVRTPDPVEALQGASARIAPAWPLDSAIAVNPWWQWRQQPMRAVAARLKVLGGIDCLMPHQWYQTQLAPDSVAPTPQLSTTPRWRNISAMIDEAEERRGKLPWTAEIEQQLSQFCGLYATHPQFLDTDTADSGLYRAWREVVQRDRGIEILMQARGLHRHFAALPECPRELTRQVFAAFGAPAAFEDYCLALILEINGWASWLAHAAWQARLGGGDKNLCEQLLAMRLAWDWVLWRHVESTDSLRFLRLRKDFLRQLSCLGEWLAQAEAAQAGLWQHQHAVEQRYQHDLQRKLRRPASPAAPSAPALQAVFCIDVRSEPLRRALEAQDAGIETLGFAGFFGLPLAWKPGTSNYRRAQLPGLLAPALEASQTPAADASARLQLAEQINQSFDSAPASLALVEMFGLTKVGPLLRRCLAPAPPHHAINALCHDGPFKLLRDGKPLTTDELADLAAGVLRHMGLAHRFAPVVLLLGHGSSTTNNPQAAALDCGACGGQTGEVNVRVLAQLLNDPALRPALALRDIHIPDYTRFHAGLHDTTTDEIRLYGHTPSGPTRAWLDAATEAARQQRATTLGINAASASRALRARSRDWGQLRPEWGLANNAAFIVAPRALTRGIDLGARCFLHDYDWRSDRDFATLELIMTAPMIVTNWINLQYYASVTDNRKYGSGNKMLHNVVAGNAGVFEGNGGDLRIGLARQSLHDGSEWRHAPLRLSVCIAAPAAAIAAIVERHAAVRELVHNEWLYLFRIEEQDGSLKRYCKHRWQPIDSEAAP